MTSGQVGVGIRAIVLSVESDPANGDILGFEHAAVIGARAAATHSVAFISGATSRGG